MNYLLYSPKIIKLDFFIKCTFYKCINVKDFYNYVFIKYYVHIDIFNNSISPIKLFNDYSMILYFCQ